MKGDNIREKMAQEIEKVAESLGSFDITPRTLANGNKKKTGNGKKQKWIRRPQRQVEEKSSKQKGKPELGKRRLVNVHILEGALKDLKEAEREKKRKAWK